MCSVLSPLLCCAVQVLQQLAGMTQLEELEVGEVGSTHLQQHRQGFGIPGVPSAADWESAPSVLGTDAGGQIAATLGGGGRTMCAAVRFLSVAKSVGTLQSARGGL